MTTLFLNDFQNQQSQPVSLGDLKQSKVYPATEGGCHLFLPPTTWGVGVDREATGNPKAPSQC